MDNSPLGKLPAELRIKIYELALYQPDSIAVRLRTDRKGRMIPCRIVALPTTCRQIRAEAMPVFVEINHFKANQHTVCMLKHARRWSPRMESVEVDFGYYRIFSGRITGLIKSLIGVRKSCREVGVRAILSVRFGWPHGTIWEAPKLWQNGLTVRLHPSGKDTTQQNLDENIQAMRKADRFRLFPRAGGIDMLYKSISEMLTALEDNPEWSWS